MYPLRFESSGLELNGLKMSSVAKIIAKAAKSIAYQLNATSQLHL
jgi:hypothetical protein